MDWWSLLFVICGSGAIIYLGLAFIWAIKYMFGSLADRVYIGNAYKGLLLAIAIMVVGVASLYVAHVTNVITMWEVGFALAR